MIAQKIDMYFIKSNRHMDHAKIGTLQLHNFFKILSFFIIVILDLQ